MVSMSAGGFGRRAVLLDLVLVRCCWIWWLYGVVGFGGVWCCLLGRFFVGDGFIRPEVCTYQIDRTLSVPN
ncbi:MAG: hypothetical protein FWG87_12025 [Defluviitaleaceae bacterium]|nr:hypothetical protein [Defluviitaleaceae bacterium]